MASRSDAVRSGLAASANIVTVVGVLSFLPSLSEVWRTPPGDPDTYVQIREGEKYFAGIMLAVGVLQSGATGTWLPLVASGVMVGLVAHHYRRAYAVVLPSQDRGTA